MSQFLSNGGCIVYIKKNKYPVLDSWFNIFSPDHSPKPTGTIFVYYLEHDDRKQGHDRQVKHEDHEGPAKKNIAIEIVSKFIECSLLTKYVIAGQHNKCDQDKK